MLRYPASGGVKELKEDQSMARCCIVKSMNMIRNGNKAPTPALTNQHGNPNQGRQVTKNLTSILTPKMTVRQSQKQTKT